MPQIFKALSSIIAWILFVAGCGYLIATFIEWAAVGFQPVHWEQQAAFNGIGVASLVLSVVVMKLRRMLE